MATTQHVDAGRYEHMVTVAVTWLIAHTTKPAIVALTVLIASVSTSLAGSVAVIAQLDLNSLTAGQVVGGTTATGIVLWSIGFFRSVYREALDVTQSSLEAERADRAEDRAAFRAEIAHRDGVIDQLRDEVSRLRDEIHELRIQLNR